MIVSINQPAYLPWMGYFDRIKQSDLHIVLDHVQFEKNSFINRNQILGPNGPVWLTVPVSTKGKFGKLEIDQIEIAQTVPWAKKHWKSIEMSYRKAPHFKKYEALLSSVYRKDWKLLNELNWELTQHFLAELGIHTEIVRSSQMGGFSHKKSNLVLEICERMDAKKYLSGALGRDYLNESDFEDKGISVEFQDFVHPVYQQANSSTFVPNLGIIDLLMNHGEGAGKIL